MSFHHTTSDLYLDSNGCPTERVWLGGQEVIVHYDDVPESDVTTIDGMRVTTPIRTVLDLAADLDLPDLDNIIEQCLERRLFTVDEALARIAAPDMVSRPGAQRLKQRLTR